MTGRRSRHLLPGGLFAGVMALTVSLEGASAAPDAEVVVTTGQTPKGKR